MRGVALTLTLLLLLAPVGLGQGGPGPGDDPCEGAADEQQCELEQRCQERPDDRRCRPSDGNATSGPDDGDDGPDGRDERPRACDDEDDEEGRDRCHAAFDDVRRGENRTWITYQLDAGNATLTGYTIDGLLALDALVLDLNTTNLSVEQHGSTLRLSDGEAELRLHDDPNGLIRFKGQDGDVTLDFPANVTITHDGLGGARIAYPGGREGHLLAENATWSADLVQLHGFFAFHVPPSGPKAEDRAADPEVEERKQEAIERRTLGAEIHLKPRPAAAANAMAAANESVEILAYDDLEVEVELPEDEADADSPLRVVVSSELPEGRTIVLNVDEALLASDDADDLDLRYYDLHDQADGSTVETEVVFHAASSLQDVLDPMDDGGQPEYWVVEDANGVQVLVSVPHWSAHAITVASIATALHAPSVTVGIVAGAAASLVMGALLVWPRRRDDEL